MDNGTIWGHGAYLGPDFSAQYLHNRSLDVADHAARGQFSRPYDKLTADEKAMIDGHVAGMMKLNRYDPATAARSLIAADADWFRRQIADWTEYFANPSKWWPRCWNGRRSE